MPTQHKVAHAVMMGERFGLLSLKPMIVLISQKYKTKYSFFQLYTLLLWSTFDLLELIMELNFIVFTYDTVVIFS